MAAIEQQPATVEDWRNALIEEFGERYTISYNPSLDGRPEFGTRWRAVLRRDLRFRGCELTVLRGSAEELQRALREQEAERPSPGAT